MYQGHVASAGAQGRLETGLGKGMTTMGVLGGLFEPRLLQFGCDEVGDRRPPEGCFRPRLFGRKRLLQQERTRGTHPGCQELLPRQGAPRAPTALGGLLISGISQVAGGASGTPDRKEGPCEKQRAWQRVKQGRREYEPGAHGRVA